MVLYLCYSCEMVEVVCCSDVTREDITSPDTIAFSKGSNISEKDQVLQSEEQEWLFSSLRVIQY